MSEHYQPRHDDEVLVTFRATYQVMPPTFPRNAYRIVSASRDWQADVDSDLAVRVEPAPVNLPTGFGARIRATIGDDRVTLVRVMSSPGGWRTQRANVGGISGYWHQEETLSDVEVLDLGEPL